MKQTMMACLILTFLFVAGTVFAAPLVLNDNYIGKGNSGDRIGNERFEISSLTLNHGGNNVKIDIDTNYTGSEVGGRNMSNTEMGDFFISTNGYNPYGSIPYMEDDYSNGEKWEYAFVFDNHDIYGTGISNGSFSLYQLNTEDTGLYDGQIITSDEIFTTDIRINQEVLVNTTLLQAIVTGGSWNVDDCGLHLSITDIFFSDFDFDAVRWQMTCANDVIEGAPVPEPATMVLFGLGLLGLAGVSRKKLTK